MKPEEFLLYLQSRGYMAVKNTAFSETGGFPHSVTAVKTGRVTTVMVQFHVTDRVPKQTLKEIKQELPKRAILASAASVGRKDVVTLSLQAKDDTFTTVFDRAVRTVVSGLRSAGVFAPTACPICRGEGTDSYALHNGVYTAVHHSCVEEHCRHTVAGIQNRQQNGNYALGFVGALLGAIVGSIPNFVTIFFMDYIIAYLCALIPLASYGGYRLFRGKANKPGTVIIVFCSILQIFVVTQAVWYAEVARYYDIWPSVIDTVRFYIASFDEDLLTSLGQTALFVGLGIAICFAVISKTADSEVKTTMSVLETLRDKRYAYAGADSDGSEPGSDDWESIE